MINVVYLVLVFGVNNGGGSVAIPQANMTQCQVNANNYYAKSRVKATYCIVGVK